MAKALIICKDEASRYLYEAAIKFQGIQVLRAKNLQAGVKSIERHDPDIIILDIEVEDIDKINTLKEAEAKQKRPPKIILTDTQKKSVISDLEAIIGVCQIITKGSDGMLGKLIKSIRKALKLK